MMNKELLIKSFYLELWNKGNFDIVSNILLEKITLRDSLGIHTRGLNEFQEYYNQLIKAFPDLHFQIEDVLVEGNKAAVKLRYSGTHKGQVFEIQPTFNEINNQEVVICTFEHDGIADIWMLGDKYAIIKQGRSEASLSMME